MECPTCRTQHDLPSKGVGGFTTNFTTASLVEILTIHGTADTSTGVTVLAIKCEDGIDNNPAATKCLDCNHYLCEDCTADHKRRRGTRNHNVATLAELKKGGVEQKRYCTDHDGQELKLYCRTCAEVICRDCAIDTHKQHDYTFIIKGVREELTKNIEDLMTSVKEKEAECQGLLDSVHKAKEKEKQKLSGQQANASRFIDDIVAGLLHRISALQVHKASLLTSLDAASAVYTKQLLADEDSLQVLHTRLTSAQAFTQQQLSSASNTDLAMMSKHVIKQLDTLRKHKLEKQTAEDSQWMVYLPEDNTLALNSKVFPTTSDAFSDAIVVLKLGKSCLLGKNTFSLVRVNGISATAAMLDLKPEVKVISSGESCPVKIEPSGSNWSVTYFIANYPQPHNDNMDCSDDEKNTVQLRTRPATSLPTVKVSVKVNGVQAKNSPFKLQLRKEMAVGTRVELHDSSQQGTVVAFVSHNSHPYHSGRHRVTRVVGLPNHASVKLDNGTSNQLGIDLLTVLTE